MTTMASDDGRGRRPLSDGLRTKAEAQALGHHYVGTEHLLLGVLRAEQCPAAQALTASSVSLLKARAALGEIIGSSRA